MDVSSEVGNVKDKICLVCGDKALGHNFNAVTCESCKAFFRRNALKDKEFKCPFNNKCEINTITRRFCQLCRLIKCFDVGMKKECIMSESDKKEKRRRVQEKRAERSSENIDEANNQVFSPKRVKLVDERSNSSIQSSCDKSCERNESTSEQPIPHPSPGLTQPSSPVGTSVVETRSPSTDLFSSIRSRPVEIYQMSKAAERSRPETISFHERSSSSIIKNILIADYEREFRSEVDCRNPEGRQCEDTLRQGQGLLQSNRRPMPILSSLVEDPSENQSYRQDVAEEVLRDIQSRKSRIELSSSIDSILSEAIKLEYEAYSSMNPRINSRELNDAERAKLNELIVANKALLAPLDDDVSSMVSQEGIYQSHLGCRPMLVDVLNLTAVAIRRLIKMSKKVNAFKNMCQEDQVALLKGGCTEMMILRSAMTYDPDRGSWKIPHSKESLMNIKVDVLKEAGGKVFEEHQRFLQTFDPRWRTDENIMLILSAITLFTPDRPRVVHYDVIKLEQNSYYYLLRRYLESTYPGCEARSTFLKLIHKISELHRLNEDHVRVYMELNPEDVEPLLIEIFDLKTPLGADIR